MWSELINEETLDDVVEILVSVGQYTRNEVFLNDIDGNSLSLDSLPHLT